MYTFLMTAFSTTPPNVVSQGHEMDAFGHSHMYVLHSAQVPDGWVRRTITPIVPLGFRYKVDLIFAMFCR